MGDNINQAIALYHATILSSPDSVLQFFGREAGEALLARIGGLWEEVGETTRGWDLDWKAGIDTGVAAAQVIGLLARSHPELNDESIRTLTNRLAFSLAR